MGVAFCKNWSHVVPETLRQLLHRDSACYKDKQRDTVYGYVRINSCKQHVINDIIEMIYNYYLWVLDSVILTDLNDINIFHNLLLPKLKFIVKGSDFNLRLLYRNSTDGNSAESFHKYCDGNVNTITLVQSKNGNIFGGFATTDWGSKINNAVKDENAFLFRIKSKFNHPPRVFRQNNLELYVFWRYGPTWMWGPDLFLQGLGCKSHSHSQLACGNEYEGTGDGPHYFELVEYEVFVVECYR